MRDDQQEVGHVCSRFLRFCRVGSMMFRFRLGLNERDEVCRWLRLSVGKRGGDVGVLSHPSLFTSDAPAFFLSLHPLRLFRILIFLSSRLCLSVECATGNIK